MQWLATDWCSPKTDQSSWIKYKISSVWRPQRTAEQTGLWVRILEERNCRLVSKHSRTTLPSGNLPILGTDWGRRQRKIESHCLQAENQAEILAISETWGQKVEFGTAQIATRPQREKPGLRSESDAVSLPGGVCQLFKLQGRNIRHWEERQRAKQNFLHFHSTEKIKNWG